MIDGQLIAKERDAWFENKDGKICLDESILKSPEMVKYLRNRLEQAFLAGVKVAEKLTEEKE
jgi:hypothetical protein